MIADDAPCHSQDDSFMRKYGRFLSRHPWEVISFSIVSTSIALLLCPLTNKCCLGSYENQNSMSESVTICVVKMLAVVNVYIELRRLIKIPNKFIIGFIIILTFLTSFTFTSIAISLFSTELSALNKAMPFFMVLVDISNPCILAIETLGSQKFSLDKAISRLGPKMIKNALIEASVIGSGVLIGNDRIIREICLFGAFLVVINSIAFLSFFASCLAVIQDVSKNSQIKADEETGRNQSNLRVHFIISVLVLFASRYDHLFTGKVTNHFSHQWIFGSTSDDFFVVTLIFVLSLKYIFYDTYSQSEMNSLTKSPSNNVTTKSHFSQEVTEKICPYQQEVTTTKEFFPQTHPSEEESPQECSPQHDDCDLTKDEMMEIIMRPNGHVRLSDSQILLLLKAKMILPYKLETILKDHSRAVSIRRQLLDVPSPIPHLYYDHYNIVDGACCENVVGFIPIPLGICGPLLLDGQVFRVPLATTEGCLVASVSRGMRALSSGVTSVITKDSMTRAPVVKFESLTEANKLVIWLEENLDVVKEIFNSSSRFCRLKEIFPRQAGRLVFIRFCASTGDAMGMNMISKCADLALSLIKEEFFPSMQIVSLSGNFCADKKPSAINWVEGRGKSVVCEAVVPASVVSSVLKTTVSSLVEVNVTKNLVGSAMAGSIGGFNAHAANIVTALYIATGQDPAQNISSSNCLTLLDYGGKSGNDLVMSCTMPSIECGTVGGGTILPPQKAALDLMGLSGPNRDEYGGNSRQLARIVCATVMAGELSLLSALSTGHLVQGHMRLNRSKINLNNN